MPGMGAALPCACGRGSFWCVCFHLCLYLQRRIQLVTALSKMSRSGSNLAIHRAACGGTSHCCCQHTVCRGTQEAAPPLPCGRPVHMHAHCVRCRGVALLTPACVCAVGNASLLRMTAGLAELARPGPVVLLLPAAAKPACRWLAIAAASSNACRPRGRVCPETLIVHAEASVSGRKTSWLLFQGGLGNCSCLSGVRSGLSLCVSQCDSRQ
jgi:hypothetical protein